MKGARADVGQLRAERIAHLASSVLACRATSMLTRLDVFAEMDLDHAAALSLMGGPPLRDGWSTGSAGRDGATEAIGAADSRVNVAMWRDFRSSGERYGL
jgi:hypothetical protein